MLLPQTRIIEIHEAVVSAGLESRSLFPGIDPRIARAAPTSASPGAQILSDLNYLNGIDPEPGVAHPFLTWLANAALLVGPRREQSVFQRAKAELERVIASRLLVVQVVPPANTGLQSASVAAVGGGAFGAYPLPPVHFLDIGPPLDFARSDTQELLKILHENIWSPTEVHRLLRQAGVATGLVNLALPPKQLWVEVLERSRAQGNLRRLLDVIAADPEYGGIATYLKLVLSSKPPSPPAPDKESQFISLPWHIPKGLDERKTGSDDTLLDVAFLEQGSLCAKSVVCLLVYHGSSASHATGFLIASDLVLTNHHALFVDGVPADEVEVWLGYELDVNHAQKPHEVIHGKKTEDAIQGDAGFDWATIRLERSASAPALPLAHGQRVKVKDRVCIIQHPNGLPKKIGLVHNEITHVQDHVIQYLTDTEKGSSGSPVFNERWNVVALHHRSIDPEAGEAGRPRNQGVLIEDVLAGLRAKGLLP